MKVKSGDCVSAWGPDADRRSKHLISLVAPGSRDGADSHYAGQRSTTGCSRANRFARLIHESPQSEQEPAITLVG